LISDILYKRTNP